MPQHHFEIGVVVARKALNNAWADHAWQAHAVLPAAPGLAPGMPLGGDLFYAGACELALHSAATAHYRDNLSSGQPSLWIALAPDAETCRVTAATADPYEGEALSEAVGGTVDRVAMPDPVRAALAAFVAAFHIERSFFKRTRDRADLELGRRPEWADK